LTGASGTVNGSTAGATKQAGEPNHNGGAGGASIWYTWTAGADGWIRFSTAGSSFDTVLAVYTGTPISALQEVASNDDAGASGQSAVDFPTTSGTTYYIAVDGFNGPVLGLATGAVVLNWQREGPPDDNLGSAFRIAGTKGSVAGSNDWATFEAGEPVNTAAPNLGGASVWYSWTAPASGHLTLTTAGSNYDTTLGVYTGSSVGGLTTLASNDDVAAGVERTSSVAVDVTGGTTYRISVDGFHGAVIGQLSGNLMLNWKLDLPAGDATLLAAGDISSCWTGFDSATGALLGLFPDATVATVGDNVYESGTPDEFNRCFNGAWGAAKARIRPSTGDREYVTAHAAGYFTYFGASAGDPTKGYYSYDLGAWHVIALNSNCSEIGGCGAGSPQETWLKSDLAAHTNTCTLAYWAAPVWTTSWVGGDSEMTVFWRDLYAAGADLVLNGHGHLYERFAPQNPSGAADQPFGIRQFVVGTGGYNHHGYGAPMYATEELRDNTSFGILALTLHAGSYDWQFVPIAGSAFTDYGSGQCHGAPAASTPPPGPTPAPPLSPTDAVHQIAAEVDSWNLSPSETKDIKALLARMLQDHPCQRLDEFAFAINAELRKSKPRLTQSQATTLLGRIARLKTILRC
jgi:hypothetical protein